MTKSDWFWQLGRVSLGRVIPVSGLHRSSGQASSYVLFSSIVLFYTLNTLKYTKAFGRTRLQLPSFCFSDEQVSRYSIYFLYSIVE